MTAFTYDPFAPAVVDDPYPFYATLRDEHPVYLIETVGVLAVSRYEDVTHVLRSPELFSSAPYGELINSAIALGDKGSLDGESLLGTDPPAHTRLRKIVNRGFTRGRMLAMRDTIHTVTHSLADDVESRGTCDLVSEFATPLPVAVIAEILGIDPERRRDFKRWSDDLLLAVTGDMSAPGRVESLRRSFEELYAYIGSVVDQRRTDPRDDLISALIRAEGDEEVMTAGEVTNFVNLLLVAGNEATTNLIGNMMLILLERPGLMPAIRAGRVDPAAVVEETMRYDSPVQLTLRRTTRDVVVAGVPVEAGRDLAVLVGSANRDRAAFEDADRFDPRRSDPAHLTFGLGAHFCIGAQLARLECAIALETLAGRFTGFERVDDAPIERPPSWLVRGPRGLRLRFETAHAERRVARRAGTVAGPSPAAREQSGGTTARRRAATPDTAARPASADGSRRRDGQTGTARSSRKDDTTS